MPQGPSKVSLGAGGLLLGEDISDERILFNRGSSITGSAAQWVTVNASDIVPTSPAMLNSCVAYLNNQCKLGIQHSGIDESYSNETKVRHSILGRNQLRGKNGKGTMERGSV